MLHCVTDSFRDTLVAVLVVVVMPVPVAALVQVLMQVLLLSAGTTDRDTNCAIESVSDWIVDNISDTAS